MAKNEIFLGAGVAAQLQADKIATVPQAWAGVFESEPLCAWQSRVRGQGYREAVIVTTKFGFSLRNASGIDSWSIIAGVRQGTTDGTLADVERIAAAWYAENPAKRVVTREAVYEAPSTQEG